LLRRRTKDVLRQNGFFTHCLFVLVLLPRRIFRALRFYRRVRRRRVTISFPRRRLQRRRCAQGALRACCAASIKRRACGWRPVAWPAAARPALPGGRCLFYASSGEVHGGRHWMAGATQSSPQQHRAAFIRVRDSSVTRCLHFRCCCGFAAFLVPLCLRFAQTC